MHGERRIARAKEDALAAAVLRAKQEREKHQRVVDQTTSLNKQISVSAKNSRGRRRSPSQSVSARS